MKYSIIYKFIFFYFVFLQALMMYIGPEMNDILFFKLTWFELGFVLSLLPIFIGIYNFIIKKELHDAKIVIGLIILYVAYQWLIVVPILYLQDNSSTKEVLYFALHRSYLLLIPFSYWYILPSFNKIKSPILIIQLICVALLIGYIYNYSMGIYNLTSTGELRIATGVAAILFTFLLITSFSLFSGGKDNLAFTIVALAGLVFANHRSAYVAIGLLVLISLLNSSRIRNRSRLLVQSGIVVFLAVIVLSQFPIISENFLGRVVTSLDTKDGNAQDRIFYYAKSFDYFLENPINGSKNDYKFYEEDTRINIDAPPHNFVFQILASQGITGFLLIFLILFYLLKIAYRNRSDNVTFQMFLVMIFYLVFAAVNFSFIADTNYYILMFCGGMILYRNKQLNDYKILSLLLSNVEGEKNNKITNSKVLQPDYS
jgi:O-antigen ligase